MMSAKKIITEHPEWGKLELTMNNRARRIIMRGVPGCLRITLPPGATMKDVEAALEMHGSTLKQRQAKSARKSIDSQFRIDGDNFSFGIEEREYNSFIMRYSGTAATLLCPAGTDYTSRQDWLRNAIRAAVGKIARKVLPARLDALAKAHGLRYNRCTVRDIHTRWGSCNSKGNISLSIYLILLPAKLMDYVLLHELCHTLHMNHSQAFWSALDGLCATDSKALRNELKGFNTDI